MLMYQKCWLVLKLLLCFSLFTCERLYYMNLAIIFIIIFFIFITGTYWMLYYSLVSLAFSLKHCL